VINPPKNVKYKWSIKRGSPIETSSPSTTLSFKTQGNYPASVTMIDVDTDKSVASASFKVEVSDPSPYYWEIQYYDWGKKNQTLRSKVRYLKNPNGMGWRDGPSRSYYKALDGSKVGQLRQDAYYVKDVCVSDREYYPNGMPQSEKSFNLKGKPHGRHSKWDKHGKCLSVYTWRNGKLNGPCLGWDRFGDKFRGNYTNGVKSGYWRITRDGKLKRESNLNAEGKLDGYQKLYTPPGTLFTEWDCVDGKRNGVMKTYSQQSGKIYSEWFYDMGKKTKAIYYDRKTGKKSHETHYDPNTGREIR